MADPYECGRPGCVHPHGCHAHSKRTGDGCRRRPIAGGTICAMHGVNTNVAAAAGRRLLADAAAADLARLGVHIEVTPIEALEALLWESAGNVAVLRQLVAGLGLHVEWVRPSIDDDGADTASVDGNSIAGQLRVDSAEAKAHVFVAMYDAERDRLARLAKDCAALGLDERRVRLAEATIERLYTATGRALQAAGLTAEQRHAFTKSLAGELRAA